MQAICFADARKNAWCLAIRIVSGFVPMLHDFSRNSRGMLRRCAAMEKSAWICERWHCPESLQREARQVDRIVILHEEESGPTRLTPLEKSRRTCDLRADILLVGFANFGRNSRLDSTHYWKPARCFHSNIQTWTPPSICWNHDARRASHLRCAALRSHDICALSGLTPDDLAFTDRAQLTPLLSRFEFDASSRSMSKALSRVTQFESRAWPKHTGKLPPPSITWSSKA